MLLEQKPDSWKDQPYVWMLILIPFSAVVVGMIMLSLAIKSDTGLVVDDYYKKGKQINRVLARDQLASKLGLSADMNFMTESSEVSVQLTADSEFQEKQTIQLGFFHATRPGLDQSLILQSVDSNNYKGKFIPLEPGRWHVHLSTEGWRLAGSMYVPGGNSLKLKAISNEL